MKYKVINKSLKKSEIEIKEVYPIEKHISTSLKTYTQHYLFSKEIDNFLYSFVIYLNISDKKCESVIKTVKFCKNGSYIPYAGGENLNWIIDTEDDLIYYLENLAIDALQHSIATSM